MPYKDPEKKKIANKLWQMNNLDKCRKYNKKYRDSSLKEKKRCRIKGWKEYGIIDDDLSAVYDYYIKETHCWICGKEYTKSINRHLDHDHETGELRYICCRTCNTRLLRKQN